MPQWLQRLQCCIFDPISLLADLWCWDNCPLLARSSHCTPWSDTETKESKQASALMCWRLHWIPRFWISILTVVLTLFDRSSAWEEFDDSAEFALMEVDASLLSTVTSFFWCWRWNVLRFPRSFWNPCWRFGITELDTSGVSLRSGGSTFTLIWWSLPSDMTATCETWGWSRPEGLR